MNFSKILSIRAKIFASIFGLMLMVTTCINASDYASGFNQNYYGLRDDVNLAFGNLVLNETDFSLPGKTSLSLAVSRVYDSQHNEASAGLDPNCNFAKKWGGWIGQGWRVNFAQRAYLIRKYEQLGGWESSHVVIETQGGFSVYDFTELNEPPGATIVFFGESNEKTNFNRVWYEDWGGERLSLITTKGLKFVFGEEAYIETHKIEDDVILEIKAFYLTSIETEFTDNRVSISYSEYEAPYDSGAEVINSNSSVNLYGKSMTNLIGDLYQKCNGLFSQLWFLDSSIQYKLQRIVQKKRPTQLTDPFYRNVTVGYEDNWHGVPANAKTKISSFQYPSVNGNTHEIRYKYSDNGQLAGVQLYTGPTDDNPETKYTYWEGRLADIENPFGGFMSYFYEDCPESYPNANFPVVVNKTVWTQVNHYDVGYAIDYIYPETDGKPDKTYYSLDGDIKVHFFESVQVNHSKLANKVITFEKARPVEEVSGIFKTITDWDDDKKRVNFVEKYVNTDRKSRIEYIYDDDGSNVKYNNVRETHIYKGAGIYKKVIKTFYEPSSSFYDTLVHLVKSEKIEFGDLDFSPKYYEYTGKGLLKKVYHALSPTNLKKSIEYEDDGRVIREETEGLDSHIIYEYNNNDTFDSKDAISLEKQWYKGGAYQYSSYSYSEKNTGKPLGAIDINGHQSSVEYDDQGRVTRKNTPDGGNITYDYSDFFTLNKTVVNNNGRSTTIEHDEFGRTEKIFTPIGEDDIEYEYYYGKKVKKQTLIGDAPLGTRTIMTTVYDDYLRPVTVTDILSTTGYAYDELNNKVTITGFQGTSKERTTVKTSNDLGMLLEEKYSAGSSVYTTTYFEEDYNAFGKPREIRDPRGLDHGHETDSYGRLTDIYNPTPGGVKKKRLGNEYDSVTGLLTTAKVYDAAESNYKTFEYVYDEYGRVLETDVSGDRKEWLRYDRDSINPKGRLTVAENNDSQTIYDYDEMGRIKQHTVTIKPLSNRVVSVGTTYKKHGGIASVTFPDSKAITYTYDANQKLNGIYYDGKLIASFSEYLSNGSLKKMTYGNNYSANYAYKSGKEVLLETIIVKDGSDNEKYRQNYNYDEFGNITSTSLPNLYEENTTVTREYTYTDVDELKTTDVTTAGNVKSYTYVYDENGNSTTFSLPRNDSVILTTHSIDANFDRITETIFPNNKKVIYSYDGEGNLILQDKKDNDVSVNTVEYQYNYQNQLKTVKKDGNVIATYAYDCSGQRIYSNTTTSEYSETKFYYWDLAGRIIAEGTDSKDYIVRYIYVGNEKIAMIRPDGTGGEDIFYFVNNAQGTPAFSMNENGRIISRQQMDEWGNLEIGVIGSENEINFTGKKLDRATGLVYFNQRYYLPEIGRFITEDPAGQFTNPYMYGVNNPLKYIDPDGEFIFAAIVLAMGITAEAGIVAGAIVAGATALDVGSWAAAANVGIQWGTNGQNWNDINWDSVGNSFMLASIGSLTGGFGVDIGWDCWAGEAIDQGINTGLTNMTAGSIGKDLTRVRYGELFSKGFDEGAGRYLAGRVVSGASLSLGQDYGLTYAEAQALVDGDVVGVVVARQLNGLPFEHFQVLMGGESDMGIIGKVVEQAGKVGSELPYISDKKNKFSGYRVVKKLTSYNKAALNKVASYGYNLLFNNCVHGAKSQY